MKDFFFQHDYNPTNDPKIICLIGNHGGLGYGIYWRVVEMLHQEDFHKLPKKTFIYEAIAKQMLTFADNVELIIKDCIKYELFIDDNKYFWCERVNRNIQKRQELSETRSIIGKKGVIAKKIKNKKEAFAEQTLAIAKQMEAKEKKEKEKKDNYNNSSSSKLEISKDAIKFSNWFKSLLPDTVKISELVLKNWSITYDDMIRIDKRTKEEIKSVCIWARQDEFWKDIFLTAIKLRKKKDGIMYYDVFLQKMKNGQSNETKYKSGAEAMKERDEYERKLNEQQ